MSAHAPRQISAGPLEMLFDGGDLRYLRVGGVEVLRRIYVGVRDNRWGTVPGVLSEVACQQSGDDCQLQFVSTHRRDNIHFVWHGSVEARAASTPAGAEIQVKFEMDGRAVWHLQTNRTGICVLHPIARCAGEPCEIAHPDGTLEHSQFPLLIAPHQPFTGIRSLAYSPLPGVRVEVSFDGEVFETEDQRNWTDGSFKTYCRPLSKGFPYELRAGERIRQTVTVRVTARSPLPARKELTIRVGDIVGLLPAIGLAARSQRWEPLDDDELALLRELNLSHLRVDLRLGRDAATLGAHVDADLLELPLEFGFHLPVQEVMAGAGSLSTQLEAYLATRAGTTTPDISRLIVYRDKQPFATAEDARVVQEQLWPREPVFPIGGGTVGNFAELNRNRPPARTLPILAWPVNPQVHATDDLSLIENLQGQAGTVRTARHIAPTAHLAVGPIILHCRPDPFAAGQVGSEESNSDGDPRQRSQFGAVWTLVSIKRLAEAGANSLTYYETTGPNGVMDDQGVFAVYHVLKAIGQMTGAHVLSCTSSDELAVDALALRQGKRLRVLVACLKDEPVDVTLRHLPDGARTIRLNPYEVSILDYNGKERL